VRAEQVCAFARRREDELAVTVAPRLYRKLLDQGGAWGAGWQGRIEVPAAGEYRDVFTGECHAAEGAGGRFWLPLGAVLAHFPVALLLGSKPK
jgi:maltooligosyltrehalose synthase